MRSGVWSRLIKDDEVWVASWELGEGGCVDGAGAPVDWGGGAAGHGSSTCGQWYCHDGAIGGA